MRWEFDNIQLHNTASYVLWTNEVGSNDGAKKPLGTLQLSGQKLQEKNKTK